MHKSERSGIDALAQAALLQELRTGRVQRFPTVTGAATVHLQMAGLARDLEIRFRSLGKAMIRDLALASVTVLTSTAAFAQGAAPAPKPIALDVALDAARTAVDTCMGNGYKVTAMIADTGLNPVVVLRNGAPAGTVDVARRKAYTVLHKNMSSLQYGQSINFTPPPPLPPGSPPRPPQVFEGDPNLTPFGGGVAVKVGGETVATVSVSGAPGGEKDNACAEAGAAKMTERMK
jgi:uncharacterized protein GlcG (DUF336 family)